MKDRGGPGHIEIKDVGPCGKLGDSRDGLQLLSATKDQKVSRAIRKGT